MLLRRITQHVKAQNWFAVGLDFFIVVFGVFVGLQVQQWADDRAHTAQHQLYYERLHADFLAIDERINGHFVIFDQSIKGLEYVLEIIRMPDDAFAVADIEEDRLVAALPNLTVLRIPPGGSATYVEMLEAGQLSRIKNNVLRDKLADYHRLSNIHMEVWRTSYDLNNTQTPIALRHYKIDSLPDKSAASGIRYVVLNYDLNGMRADPDFEIALTIFEASVRNNYGVRRFEKQLTSEILALLNGETTP